MPSSTTIDMKELTESGIGSLLENKIKRYIEKIEGLNIKIRYFWNFISISNKSSDYQDFPEEKYDFETFMPIEYDDIKKNEITENNIIYYIIPGSQTKRSLDAILLIPYGENEFNMICLQITKHKKTIKTKNEYIFDCFMAKSKFEGCYGIKINKVYFYFVLAKECMNEDTKKNLQINNIDYFYYSIKKEIFEKNDEKINITNLCNTEAEISQKIEGDQYISFEKKMN